MNKPSNPPAFPVPETCFDDKSFEPEHIGMSLRDYFAGQASISLLCYLDSRDGCPAEVFAKSAYEMADAMLTERSRKDSTNETS